MQEDIKELKKLYMATFNTKEGEVVLEDLTQAYYHRSSFTKDPYETAFKEGQRAVVVRILNLLKEDNNNG